MRKQSTVPLMMSDDDEELDVRPGPSVYFRSVALTARARSESESEESEAGPSWIMDVDSGDEADGRLVPIEEGDISMHTLSDSDDKEISIDPRILHPRYRRYQNRMDQLWGKRK